jgi:hypothetical protein
MMSPRYLFCKEFPPMRTYLTAMTQCITLPPVVAIQTKFATPEDKEALARGLTSSGKPGTGSVDGDIIAFSSEIAR